MLRITLVYVDEQSNSQRIVLTIPNQSPGNNQLELHQIKNFDQLTKSNESNEQTRVLTRIEADQILALLDELTIPVVPKVKKSKETDTHMLKLEQEENSITFFWFTEPPPGWEKIGALSSLLINFANSA